MRAVEADRPLEVQGMALTGCEAEIDGGEDIQIVACLEVRLSLYLPLGMGVLHTQPTTEVPLR